MAIVFIDRDGVINHNRDDYVKSWDEFEFLPGSLEALRELAEMQCRVVVVTNQSVINRGIVSREEVEDINRKMVEEVAANGGQIEAVFYCPHRPDEDCQCRKPKPGLLHRAKELLDVDLSTTFLVGDKITDIETARAAGCRASVLVSSGPLDDQSGLTQESGQANIYLADDLRHAVTIIRSISAPSNVDPQ